MISISIYKYQMVENITIKRFEYDIPVLLKLLLKNPRGS